MCDFLPSGWRSVPLREIAQPIKRPVTIQDEVQYRTMGVKWWGEGAYERETRYGREIKSSKLFAVRSGDLVINRIWVRHGSSGIIDEMLEGCVVTQDFPTFQLDTSQVVTAWLRYMFKAAWFWQECDNKSRGTSGRQRINPDEYLDSIIPLPPLEEQQRIVAKLDALRVRVEQALALQAAAIDLSHHWFISSQRQYFEQLVTNYGARPLKGLFSFRQELQRHKTGERGNVRFIGLQHIEPNTGRRIGEDLIKLEELSGRKFRFFPGDIVYGYLRPYLNKVWVADCDGLCSVDQYVLRPDNATVLTRYLAHAMRSPLFLKQSEELTGLLTLPRLRSGLLEQIEIPVPPLEVQERVVEQLDALYTLFGELTSLQQQSMEEIEALLPATLNRAFRGKM